MCACVQWKIVFCTCASAFKVKCTHICAYWFILHLYLISAPFIIVCVLFHLHNVHTFNAVNAIHYCYIFLPKLFALWFNLANFIFIFVISEIFSYYWSFHFDCEWVYWNIHCTDHFNKMISESNSWTKHLHIHKSMFGFPMNSPVL